MPSRPSSLQVARAFFRPSYELQAPGGVKHGAATVDDSADAVAGQRDEITVDQSAPAPADADALNPLAHRRTDHRPDRRVHAGRVPSAGQYADAFDFITHIAGLLIF